jgi:hypothetical protein
MTFTNVKATLMGDEHRMLRTRILVRSYRVGVSTLVRPRMSLRIPLVPIDVELGDVGLGGVDTLAQVDWLRLAAVIRTVFNNEVRKVIVHEVRLIRMSLRQLMGVSIPLRIRDKANEASAFSRLRTGLRPFR